MFAKFRITRIPALSYVSTPSLPVRAPRGGVTISQPVSIRSLDRFGYHNPFKYILIIIHQEFKQETGTRQRVVTLYNAPPPPPPQHRRPPTPRTAFPKYIHIRERVAPARATSANHCFYGIQRRSTPYQSQMTFDVHFSQLLLCSSSRMGILPDLTVSLLASGFCLGRERLQRFSISIASLTLSPAPRPHHCLIRIDLAIRKQSPLRCPVAHSSIHNPPRSNGERPSLAG